MSLKNLIITVVVAIVVAAGVSSVVAPHAAQIAAQSAVSTLGGSINNVQQVIWQFASGVSLDPAGSNGGAGSVIFTKSGTIGTGQNQGVWTNKTGRTVYIDYADAVMTSGNASSSMRLSALATTTNSIADSMWLTNPESASAATTTTLIGAFQIATGTKGVIINSDITTGMTNASGTIAVADGQSLIFYLQQWNTGACLKPASICEQATSTNRGFNLDWFIAGHFRP